MALLHIFGRRSLPLFLLAVALLATLALQTVAPSQAERASVPDSSHAALNGLSSASAVDRANAVKALRVTHDVTAVPTLIAHLDDPDQAVGLYIAQTLGELATPAVLPDLRSALQSPDPNVRWRAAYALGELRDEGAVDALTSALRDPDVLVQRTSAEALGNIANQDAIQVLAGALGSPLPSVGAGAMSALEKIGEPAVMPLVAATGSNNAVARRNAATVLGYIASPKAAPALQLAAIDSDPEVRAEAEWALEQIHMAQGK